MAHVVVSLEGKKAVVTGGKRGIGRGIALALAGAGADVAVCSRGGDELEAVAKEIRGLGRRSLAMEADVSRRSDVEALVRTVSGEFGTIDILVNAAGVAVWNEPLLEISEESWDYTSDINLKGCFQCSQLFGREMAKRKQGVIINIASIGALAPAPGIGVYSVSKSAVVMLTRALALELAPLSIRVNGISPGWIRTDMNAQLRADAEFEKSIAGGIPLRRWGEPEDIANVALFFASDLSGYITGQTVLVDGGLFDTVLCG